MFALYFYFGIGIMEINIKLFNFSQINCFKEIKNMAIDLGYDKKTRESVITWNKKQLSRHVVPITQTLEERLFCCRYTFEGF